MAIISHYVKHSGHPPRRERGGGLRWLLVRVLRKKDGLLFFLEVVLGSKARQNVLASCKSPEPRLLLLSRLVIGNAHPHPNPPGPRPPGAWWHWWC
jgi:hypothetical protein